MDQFGNSLGRNVANVTPARSKKVYLRGVDVEAEDRVTRGGEALGQGKSDVAEADDTDTRRP